MISGEVSLYVMQDGIVTESYDVERKSTSNRISARSSGGIWYGGEIGEVTIYPKPEQDDCTVCGGGANSVSSVSIPGAGISSGWNLTGTGGTGPTHSSVNTSSLESQKLRVTFLSKVMEKQSLVDPTLILDKEDCDELEKMLEGWGELAQHEVPQAVLDKIKKLPSNWANDFEIQDIENASGTVVNMDYFAVNITKLPQNKKTGKEFSPSEYLNYFRKNINDFFRDDFLGSTFKPYCKDVSPSICKQETDLWNSDNPLGSVIYIDIPGDDGVVVMSDYTENYWNFTTMNAPYAGNHPVSGTRQFGYNLNSDGSYDFYVRGVDRIDSNSIENIAYLPSYAVEDEFNSFVAADLLWKSYQEKMNEFVNKNGGKSTVIDPEIHRPDWEDVRDVLLGKKTLQDLGCE